MQGKGQGQQQLAAVEPPHCGWFLEVDPSSTLVSAHSTMAKKKKKGIVPRAFVSQGVEDTLSIWHCQNTWQRV